METVHCSASDSVYSTDWSVSCFGPDLGRPNMSIARRAEVAMKEHHWNAAIAMAALPVWHALVYLRLYW
ncbi:hypothetical protein LIPSTDRAFT_69091 [Lipomyces starkeyi NRRL Y-11557]|uniref:Uncharacterized protein n=1 Tax=Lipomyces starkeyi NRRL Y-11557 TaxID=675824 RepID=A0A1E3QB74_LIPST|nr:hypothetical protein LIPSTDRAFT_69091 [Lipomyces starkeyi NRRL Y-11557]